MIDDETIKWNNNTLNVLKNAKPKLRIGIFSEGGKELIKRRKECVLNVLNGNIPLSTGLKRRLEKHN